jgi:NAD(P)-dependent dehydrogenase (short-subunit alcohol dehydrogenase family)
MTAWNTADIPPQTGKFAVVTGANSGIGYYTALELARAGAQVIIASRNEARGLTAAAAINEKIPGKRASFEWLDLASLASVASFASRILASLPALDILINNAGVMALPQRETTEDGFEMQIGVNYLGHFALTAQLLPLLRKAAAPRAVQLSSLVHRNGRIDFADLQSEKYSGWTAYSQSKLAMLMFALELQRRSDANGWNILSIAAHPGLSKTELVANGLGNKTIFGRLTGLSVAIMGQSAAAGALPTLYAATSASVVPGGCYYGPLGFQEFKGPPGVAVIKPHAEDPGVAKRLWEISEGLTKTEFV